MDSTVTDTRRLMKLTPHKSLAYFLDVSNGAKVAKRRHAKHLAMVTARPWRYHPKIVNSKAECVALMAELKAKRVAAQVDLDVVPPRKVTLKKPTRYEVRHTVTDKFVVWDTRDQRIVGIYGSLDQAREATRLVGKSWSLETREVNKPSRRRVPRYANFSAR